MGHLLFLTNVSIFCVAGLTDDIQELVTKTIRSPPINSGINGSFLVHSEYSKTPQLRIWIFPI